jgi:hypothetical protein
VTGVPAGDRANTRYCLEGFARVAAAGGEAPRPIGAAEAPLEAAGVAPYPFVRLLAGPLRASGRWRIGPLVLRKLSLEERTYGKHQRSVSQDEGSLLFRVCVAALTLKLLYASTT